MEWFRPSSFNLKIDPVPGVKVEDFYVKRNPDWRVVNPNLAIPDTDESLDSHYEVNPHTSRRYISLDDYGLFVSKPATKDVIGEEATGKELDTIFLENKENPNLFYDKYWNGMVKDTEDEEGGVKIKPNLSAIAKENATKHIKELKDYAKEHGVDMHHLLLRGAYQTRTALSQIKPKYKTLNTNVKMVEDSDDVYDAQNFDNLASMKARVLYLNELKNQFKKEGYDLTNDQGFFKALAKSDPSIIGAVGAIFEKQGRDFTPKGYTPAEWKKALNGWYNAKAKTANTLNKISNSTKRPINVVK